MNPGGEAAYRRLRLHGGYADLSSRAKFRMGGADRVRYLNGQVTAHVSAAASDRAQPACVTTAKGKLCGEIYFAEIEPGLLFLDAEAELQEALRARLERYIVADDVTLEDITAEYALIHLLGVEPGEHLRSTARLMPAHRYGQSGLDLWLPRSRWLAEGAELMSGLEVISPELLETVRLEAGIPRWGRELGPETLPPEAGLDRTHIDYQKGCYIGQETISRLRSVGHVNRSLTGFISLTGKPLTAGMRLLAEGRAAGELTSAGWSFALAKPVALGYLKRGSPTDGLTARPAHAEEPAVPVVSSGLPFAAL